MKGFAVPADLLFQYNDPTQTSRGRPINRLMKWAVTSVTVLQFPVQILMVAAVPPVPAQQEYHTLQLTMDINIAPSEIPIGLEEAAEIISNLRMRQKPLSRDAN